MYQEKIVFALAGVIVGFLVNKVYDVISNKLKRNHIHSSLIEELTSLLAGLENIKTLYEMKIEGKEDFHDDSFPRKISAPIYEKYYTDVCLYLNRSQRYSFQQIYVILDELNEFITKFFMEKCEDEDCVSRCKLRLATSYGTVCDLIFLVENHVEYNRQPIISTQLSPELAENRKSVDIYLKKHGCVIG